MADTPNPLEPSQSLKRPFETNQTEEAHPPQPILAEDSAITKAEKVERNGETEVKESVGDSEPTAKRVKVDSEPEATKPVEQNGRIKGMASIKKEFLIYPVGSNGSRKAEAATNDVAKEQKIDARDIPGGQKKKEKSKGQNISRNFGSSNDAIKLCNSRATYPEFSPRICSFGDRCNMEHDIRRYLKEGKREDMTTFGSKCPVWEANGRCHAGWKCRFVGSHSKEVEHEDGRKELVLIEDETRVAPGTEQNDDVRKGVVNVVSTAQKLQLAKKKVQTEKSEAYSKWLDKDAKDIDRVHNKKKGEDNEVEDNRAMYTEPPFLPSEKRRIYFGAETPVLAPLTTQGNLPYRRLCVELGAQLTYSEMAMSLPIIQGQKSEWALMKAHESEISPPRYTPKGIVQNYNNSKDLKFGAQVSANKPWVAIKGAEVLSTMLPHLRVIDLNCGCPIELVCRTGAGSQLLDAPAKLEKLVRGMNAVSGEVPITAKIRMGTRDAKPNAPKVIERLAFGGAEVRDRLGAPGCAAITLHGRSKQQRYTKNADWSYIAECATLIKEYNSKKDSLADTIMETDARTLPNSKDGKIYFIGNGDCYSHVDYYDHINNAGVDSVMSARGALVKPWLFEEIEQGQYLDKSSTERLTYVEKFCRYGLEAWGSDEIGVGQTRRFLLEWLSFAHRYVPVGLLEYLPPNLQDRPPAYRGRDELETLLASDNYKDWIKISEMFLGPAHKDFQFQPKHKSNSYEIEAEG